MEYDVIFRLIELLLQFLIVVFAWQALSAWKSEVRGKDDYDFAKGLLEYVQELRFLIHGKDKSLHQIFLRDILINKRDFYDKQLSEVGGDLLYFDESVWKLFNHINTRSNLFISSKLKASLEDLLPASAHLVSEVKGDYTFVQLKSSSEYFSKDEVLEEGVYIINSVECLTVKEYFKKWEVLLLELKKIA